MDAFKLISETVDYENPFFAVVDRLYELPDGTQKHFYVRQEVDTCCVLAMTKEGQFVFEEEHRVGPGKSLLQLPAGRLESDKDNADIRIAYELKEETGYTGRFMKVGEMPASPYSTRTIHCYYATECEKVTEQELDEGEFIDVKLLSPEEAYEVLLSGQSSSAAPGLLAWEHMRKDGKV